MLSQSSLQLHIPTPAHKYDVVPKLSDNFRFCRKSGEECESKLWQVLWQHTVTADRFSPLLNTSKSINDIGVLHAWSKSHSKAILLNDKHTVEGGFSTGIRILLCPCLFHYFRNLLNHPYIIFGHEIVTCLFCYRSIIQNTCLFCYRSALQIISQFALLLYSFSDRLSILLAQNCHSRLFVLLPRNCRSHLSVLLPQRRWIHFSASLIVSVFVLLL